MDSYDLIVVGGGASGLLAAITALEKGIKKVLIIEREEYLGGNLNLFIHNGFGENTLGVKLTGPEYATILSRKFYELGGESKLATEVLDISKDKLITYINSESGLREIKADYILIAAGCKERFTGSVIAPKDRYTGIYTVATAHRLINFEGYLPGREVIISAKNKWAMILARRLMIEGANVKAIIDISDEQDLNKYSYLIDSFDTELINGARITEIIGEDKIEGVIIDDYKNNNSKIVSCDSIILSVSYAPNINICKVIDTDLKDNLRYPKVDNFRTNIQGIYACGTFINGEKLLEHSDLDGRKAGMKIVEDSENLQ